MSTNFGFPSCKRGEGHPYLFISYKSEESSIAAKFARHLYDNNIRIYYDNALKDAVEWEKELLCAIEDKDCLGVVMMVSAQSLKSPHVQNEAQAANHCGKVVLGVFIENVVVTEQPMKTYLGNVQAIPVWSLSEEEALQRVIIGAFRLMNRTYTPDYRKASIEEIYTQAFPIIHRFSISNNNEDFQMAYNILKSMTELYPTDYRGWQYLANLCCAKKPDSPTEALHLLTLADENYKAVELVGKERQTSTDYEKNKSQLLSRTIEICRAKAKSIYSSEGVSNLISTLQQIQKHINHIDSQIRNDYELLLDQLKKELTEVKNREEKMRKKMRIEKIIENRKRRFVISGIFGGITFLGLMILFIYTMWCIRSKNMDISTTLPLQIIRSIFIQENFLNHLLISISMCIPFIIVSFILMPRMTKITLLFGVLSATISQTLCLLIYLWISPPFLTYVEQALCLLCNIGLMILGISVSLYLFYEGIELESFDEEDLFLASSFAVFIAVFLLSLLSLLIPSLLLFIPNIVGFVFIIVYPVFLIVLLIVLYVLVENFY